MLTITSRIALFCMVLSSLLWSCEKQDGPELSDNRCSTGLSGMILADKARYDSWDTDEFLADTIWIEGSVLHCQLQYGGGCEQVYLEMVSDRSERDSNIPQAMLRAVFTDNDPCEALITDTFCFDLHSLEFKASGPKALIFIEDWNTALIWDR